MNYWKDDYLESLTMSDRPGYLRETVSVLPQNNTPNSQVNNQVNNKKSPLERQIDKLGLQPPMIIIHKVEDIYTIYQYNKNGLFPYERNGQLEAFNINDSNLIEPSSAQGKKENANRVSMNTLLKNENNSEHFFDFKKQHIENNEFLYFSKDIETIDVQFLKRNNFKLSKESVSWLYAQGKIGKSWNKNWGSEVMGEIHNAISSHPNISWK